MVGAALLPLADLGPIEGARKGGELLGGETTGVARMPWLPWHRLQGGQRGRGWRACGAIGRANQLQRGGWALPGPWGGEAAGGAGPIGGRRGGGHGDGSDGVRSEEGKGPRPHHRDPVCGGPWPPSVDAPGAAGDELDAGDEVACFEGFLDGGLVRLAGGGEAQPLGIEGFPVVDLDRLGLARGQLVIRERKAGGSGLQLGEDNDQ
jgi:hypothetical protein